MAKKKKKEVELPPAQIDLLADKIYNQYIAARDTGNYCVIDRTKGFQFYEVLKDGVWSYVGNGDGYDSILLIERLFLKEKCKTIKYPTYEASEETIQLYKELSEFLAEKVDKKDLHGSAVDERGVKIKEYIDKINSIPPLIKDIDQLSYVDGYNTELGFPVIALSELSVEVIKSISYKLASYSLTHFSTMSFLYGDNFSIWTEYVTVDPEAFNDIIVIFKDNGLNIV